MNKEDFEIAINRSIEAMLRRTAGGRRYLAYKRSVRGINLELMSQDKRYIYLFGVQAGYMLGTGEIYYAMFWEGDDD